MKDTTENSSRPNQLYQVILPLIKMGIGRNTVKWWVRLQFGHQLVGQIINLIMLSAAVSPTIGKFLNTRAIYVLVILPIIIGCLLITVGYIMDRLGWYQKQEEQSRKHATIWEANFKQLDRIERKIKKKKLYRRK